VEKPKITLLQPFDWCYIPAGKVTLLPDALDRGIYVKQDMVVDVPEFYMAKYPITNGQYRDFIDDGGAKPYYWDDKNWNGDDYPVIAITWYDAVKFCQWLGGKTGENIMLPTDAMWQRAAQGDDGRKYTWGNVWDIRLCNSNVDRQGIGKTTPVRQYEGKADSPFGVSDMIGNVWEWCLTTYATGENRVAGHHGDERIFRGGSWYTKEVERMTCTFRHRNNPLNGGYSNRGFRIACLLDSSVMAKS
jgi:formylglycine-generating enzyme required for sulfatase activity